MNRQLILTVCVLALMHLLAHAACADDLKRQPTTGPLIAYAWTAEAHRHPNIVPMYWLSDQRDLNDVSLAKDATDAMPQGHRVLFLWEFTRDIHVHPDDFCRTSDGRLTEIRGVWWDHGVERVAKRIDAWFGEFKKLGGHVDVVVLDNEVGLGNWSIGGQPDRWDGIAGDPRFEEIAQQLGFRDLALVRNWRRGDHFHHWNDLMLRRKTADFARAVYDPIRRHFPDVEFSNYGHSASGPQIVCPDANGHWSDKVGGDYTVGTHQSPSLYAWLGNLQRMRYVDGRFRTTGRGPLYGNSPFAGLRWSVNRMRTSSLSSAKPVRPWVSHKHFKNSTVRDSDLYQELLFHILLSGADGLLLWNPRAHHADADPSHYGDEQQDQLVCDCLAQVDQLLGDVPRVSLVDELSRWDGDCILTGMQTENGSLWRLTPELTVRQSRESILVSKEPLEFRTATETIRFPTGQVVNPEPALSESGWWIVASAAARPKRMALKAK